MTGPARTIAVIDDDPDTLLLAAASLAAAGHRVITDDGSPGIGNRLADAHPDLILLELHLRDRDGEDALHEIRAEHRLALTPVLGFTAALPGDPTLTRLEHRLAGRIPKPLDPTALANAVERALGDAPPGGSEAERGAAATADPDLEALHHRFLAGLGDRAERISEAAARQDVHALIAEIHHLRADAGGWNLGDLAAEAANAEHLLRTADPDAPDAISRLLASIRQYQE